MKKYWWPFVGMVALIILVIAWSGVATAPESGNLTIKGHAFKVEYADTPEAQEKGLGGRDNLPSNHAMLFRFTADGEHCFWMKDMRFSLDIIWINPEKKVVHIKPDVSPATFPHNFCPPEPSQYVLEVNAGVSQQIDLRVGDSLSF
ncbi:MAG TPA: DUF192 domain-containing protein [Candidatus Saccharimonadales bacterium]|nr:DUF192 domain-containing protein [Candidatus Saccharimonadales bacterium]